MKRLLLVLHASVLMAVTNVTVTQTIYTSDNSLANGTATLSLTGPCTDRSDARITREVPVTVSIVNGAFSRSLQATSKCMENPGPQYKVVFSFTNDVVTTRIRYWHIYADGTVEETAEQRSRWVSVAAPLSISDAGISCATCLSSAASYPDPTWVPSLAASKLTGTVAAGRMPALTGDVTTSAGSVATTIATAAVSSAKLADNAVTNAKLATMADQRLKGNVSGGTASPSDLTPAQVAAMLPVFVGDSGSGGTKGSVPAPASGDATKFLRADGTWTAVAPGLVDILSLSELSDVAGKTGTGTTVVMAASPTITTPTIASFVNASHSHQDAAGGGVLAAAAIGSGQLSADRIPSLDGAKVTGLTLPAIVAGGTTGIYQAADRVFGYFTPSLGAGGQSLGDNLFVGRAGNSTMTNGASTTLYLASKNIGIGTAALSSNTTGFYNTATGWSSMRSNTSGNSNSGFGYLSLDSNTTGQYNTGIGAWALFVNTTGVDNTAVGADSQFSMVSGSRNTSVGTYSLFANASGSDNIAIGNRVVFNQTSGDDNLAIGNWSGYANINGSRNMMLGSHAGRYETGSDKFYVNNRDRSNIGGDRSGSLLYGTFAANRADQRLTINGWLGVNGEPSALLHVVGGTGESRLAVFGEGVGANQRAMAIGYNHDLDYGWLQATHQDVGHKPIALQPSGGAVSVGTAAPPSGITMFVQGANVTPSYNTHGMVSIMSSDNQAADIGGSITLGGNKTDNIKSVFASIEGRKANGTDNDLSGYLSLKTSQENVGLVERIRVGSDGTVRINGLASAGTRFVCSNSSGELFVSQTACN